MGTLRKQLNQYNSIVQFKYVRGDPRTFKRFFVLQNKAIKLDFPELPAATSNCPPLRNGLAACVREIPPSSCTPQPLRCFSIVINYWITLLLEYYVVFFLFLVILSLSICMQCSQDTHSVLDCEILGCGSINPAYHHAWVN